MPIARLVLLAAFVCLIAAPVVAQANPVLGLWKNVETEKTVYFRLTEEGGILKGKVERVVKGGKDDDAVTCTKCEGDLKDKPVKGMLIMWEMKKDGERWSGGKILDPDSGKVYNCRVEVADGGKVLKVRGSIAFLSKTQSWTREP